MRCQCRYSASVGDATHCRASDEQRVGAKNQIVEPCCGEAAMRVIRMSYLSVKLQWLAGDKIEG